MQTISLDSPCKLNLRLDIVGKRSDGYHELRSVMERINLSDQVEINIVEKGIMVTCDNEAVPQDEDNIAFKAIKEILAYSSRNVGVEVHIKKKIPIAAGLGGGSSNAATVIKGINQLLKLKLPKEKLMQIGLKVGADVPFFLFEGPAIAEGVGEQLKKIKSMPKLLFLLVNPNIPVTTESVYRKYSMEGAHKNGMEVPNIYRTKRDVAKILNNDLERVTIKDYPVIGEIKEEMIRLGALASQMTGSGPTVFGIFADKIKLTKAFDKMEKRAQRGWKIFMVENLAA